VSSRVSRPYVRGAGGEPFWRALLPGDVLHSAGFAPQTLSLTAAELASLGPAGEPRRREFAVGRWHARAALSRIGHDAGDLPRTSFGTPAWPTGVVGSIAHSAIDGQVVAVAVVASRRHDDAIGVDLEPRHRIPARDWPELLCADELSAVATLSVAHRSLAVLQLWCAKEAAAKAGLANGADVRRVAVIAESGEAAFARDGGGVGVRSFAVRGARASGRMGLAPQFAAAFCAVPASVPR